MSRSVLPVICIINCNPFSSGCIYSPKFAVTFAIDLENKYKEAETKILSLKEELDRINKELEKRSELQIIEKELNHRESIINIEQLNNKTEETQINIKPLSNSKHKPKYKPEKEPKEIKRSEEKNDSFGGVLLTDEYKKQLESLKKKKLGFKCLICKEETVLSDISLLNGWKVHQSCYYEYAKKVCNVNEEDAEVYFQENTNTVCMYKIIHSYWPTYPPDWNQRGRIILEQANYACEKCGETEAELHIHHKKELGVGGNHNLRNLKCLCVDCHEKITPGGFEGNHRGTWIKRKKIIEEAIREEANIYFNYINKEKERSTRTIKPIKFITFSKTEQHLGVIGYCFLRAEVFGEKEMTSFYIQRMSQLEILHDKSVKKGFYHDIVYPLHTAVGDI